MPNLTLLEAARMSKDELTLFINQEDIEVNDLYAKLPFQSIPGGALSYERLPEETPPTNGDNPTE